MIRSNRTMPPNRRRFPGIVAGMALSMASVMGLPAGAGIPRVESAIDMHLDLHNLLMVASEAEPPSVEYRVEAEQYLAARSVISNRLAWRFINDAILEGPDMAAILAREAQIPAGLSADDKDGVRRIFKALASAWPRYEAKDLISRRISLQNNLVQVIRGRFGRTLEGRLMPVLYEKMALVPVDAPITVYPVVDAIEVGVVGRTSAGYYVVIPVKRRPALFIIETMIHEMTHILDAAQPDGRSTLLGRVSSAARGADPMALDDLLHALVTYNAGQLVRRYGKSDHLPMVDISPPLRERVEKYRRTFDGAWSDYLDGKIDADAVVAALVAALPPKTSRAP